MEEKKLHISLSTIFLIIAIIVIIVMGFTIYYLLKNKQEDNNEINKLRIESQNMQEKLENIQEVLNNINIITKDNNDTNKEKSDEEQIKEISNTFVKAVNEKDWVTVEKYSSAGIVNMLKQYNVTNMTIDFSNIEKNPNEEEGYYFTSDYDINYQGSTNKKDFYLGRLFCVNKKDGNFIVTACGATGL